MIRRYGEGISCLAVYVLLLGWRITGQTNSNRKKLNGNLNIKYIKYIKHIKHIL